MICMNLVVRLFLLIGVIEAIVRIGRLREVWVLQKPKKINNREGESVLLQCPVLNIHAVFNFLYFCWYHMVCNKISYSFYDGAQMVDFVLTKKKNEKPDKIT